MGQSRREFLRGVGGVVAALPVLVAFGNTEPVKKAMAAALVEGTPPIVALAETYSWAVDVSVLKSGGGAIPLIEGPVPISFRMGDDRKVVASLLRDDMPLQGMEEVASESVVLPSGWRRTTRPRTGGRYE